MAASQDLESVQVKHVVHTIDVDTTSDSESNQDLSDDEFTPEEQKKIIRRINLWLVLTAGAMYCISSV
jgi:hypothetical protein